MCGSRARLATYIECNASDRMQAPKHSPQPERFGLQHWPHYAKPDFACLDGVSAIGTDHWRGGGAPATTMSLENYPGLTDSEFSLFRADAESFAEALACQGITIWIHDADAYFFDLSVRDDPILFVDNSGPSLLAVTMYAVSSDAIELQRWTDGCGSPERRRRNLNPPENSCPRSASQ